MFFKRSKVDKSKAPNDAPEAAPAAQSAAEEAAAATSPIEPASPLGAHTNSAGLTDAASLGFKTTADLKPTEGPIGQTKALEAIQFAAAMKGPGYHMLVVGPTGSGRRTATRARLQEVASKAERPADWVYVSSFDPTGGFRALKLPAGTAKPFAERMALAIEHLADALPAAFAADDYDLKRRTIEEEFRFSREDALEALRREAETQNIALLRTPAGIAVAPVLEGKVVIEDDVQIGPNCVIKNTTLRKGAVVKANSHLEGAVMGEGSDAGPFARLRPGSVLDAKAHVGNFVELKNAHLGEGAKAGHLTYLGDAEIGARTNIGAGTITCNYDGANKFKTVMGEDVFIGSNNSLVAPVEIKAGATTAAGSTITQAVEAGDLAVARARQRNISGWKRPEKIKKS